MSELIALLVVLGTSFACTLVHETGHLLAARIGGLPVLVFRIWGGRPLLRFKFRGVFVELGRQPGGGGVFVLSNIARRLVREREVYAHLRERMENDPRLSEAAAQVATQRYGIWTLFFALGPIVEALVVGTAIYFAQDIQSDELWVKWMKWTLQLHLFIAFGSLLPVRLGTAGMDGFNLCLMFVLKVSKMCTGRHLDPDTLAQRLSKILTPFGILLLVPMAMLFLRITATLGLTF